MPEARPVRPAALPHTTSETRRARGFRQLALVSGLALLGWLGWNIPQPSLRFVTPPDQVMAAPPPQASTPKTPAAPPQFEYSLLPRAAASAHAATLAQAADGRLLVAWFAGSIEGAEDVAIYLSQRTKSGWSPPAAIATRQQTADELHQHLRKLGNPVLYKDAAQRLHLFFVSVSIGGWAGSAINHKYSTDDGMHWSPARQLITSPFLNISTLVRTPPVALAEGGLGLPVYHEFMHKHGEWLRLGGDLRTPVVEDKVRMPIPRAVLQPAVAVLGPEQALALLRDSGPSPGHIQQAITQDAGQHWTALPPLPIRNPNASVALLRLSKGITSGGLLLAANPGPGRSRLALYYSATNGSDDTHPPTHANRVWQSLGEIEVSTSPDDKLAEFSYPSLLEDENGDIHLVYTWNREAIRHVRFNPAWIAQRLNQPAPPAIPATVLPTNPPETAP